MRRNESCQVEKESQCKVIASRRTTKRRGAPHCGKPLKSPRRRLNLRGVKNSFIRKLITMELMDVDAH